MKPACPTTVSAPPAIISSSAPGRICLFGEHQDYLRLPVIAMAVDLRVNIEGRRRDDNQMRMTLTDIGETFEFNPNEPFTYRHNRDYVPAAANVLARLHGVSWPAGYDIEVTGRIPINAGASSSSALQIAWTAFLLAAAGDPRAAEPEFVAHVAQFSEVGEFGSPGGMMDHYSSALGGVVYLDCLEPIGWERLPDTIGPFVLIDSGTPKATNEVLGRVRKGVEAAATAAGINLHDAGAPSPLLNVNPAKLPAPENAEQDAMLRAALRNRDITREARAAMLSGAAPAEIGKLLDAHHEQLARGLGISTERIDALLATARAAGAAGGKINGSGGGGSCFALAPDNADAVAEAIRAQGCRADVVRPGEGLRVTT